MKTTTKPKAAPAAAPTPAAAGIKKINLGGIASKAEKTATAYPVLPDPTGDAAKLASDIITESREMEAIEGSLKLKKSELRSIAQEFYFQHLHGKHFKYSRFTVLTLISLLSANRTEPTLEPFFVILTLKILFWWSLLEKREPYRDEFLHEKSLKIDIYAERFALTALFSCKK